MQLAKILAPYGSRAGIGLNNIAAVLYFQQCQPKQFAIAFDPRLIGEFTNVQGGISQNSRDSTAVGAQTTFSGRGFLTFARATVDQTFGIGSMLPLDVGNQTVEVDMLPIHLHLDLLKQEFTNMLLP
ncbi:MAG: hypothetical protein F6J92_34860 [Symploca sp. SIO1A3]|nr:hypothetical protein [Symploca sp. SIO1A3]